MIDKLRNVKPVNQSKFMIVYQIHFHDESQGAKLPLVT